MKIAFVQATNSVDVQWSAPIGFGYMKAYVEQVAPDLVDIRLVRSAEEALAMNPEVVGISTFSQDFNEAQRLAQQIRENSDAIIVLGGQHISALPGTLPPAADVGVMGEGEITFAELLSAVASGRKELPQALSEIPGLVYRYGGGELRFTGKRDLLPNLDLLPMPDWRLRLDQGQTPYVFTSRGCPYRCQFCSSAVYWKLYRLHSAGRVVQEMESILREFPKTEHIMSWDDLFVANRVRFREIVDMAEGRGLTERTKFSCTVRANLVNSKLCSLLKRLNIGSVAFGAESGSDRILSTLKTGMTVEVNQRALDNLSAAGIPTACSFIVGSPGETAEDVAATYEFIRRNTAGGKLTFYDVNVLTPMPGSQTWFEAERQGLVGSKMNWDRLRYFASRQTNAGGFDQWAKLRRENRSVYLNEGTLPEAQLMELMAGYEAMVARERDGQREESRPDDASPIRLESIPRQSGDGAEVRQESVHRVAELERALAEAVKVTGQLERQVAEEERALAEVAERLREREVELAKAQDLIERIARGRVMRLMNAFHALRRKWLTKA